MIGHSILPVTVGCQDSLAEPVALTLHAIYCFGMAIVDFNARRVGRLEKQQRETNLRLGRVEESLGRVADILEAHSRHFERLEGALIGISEQIDRLTTAIARGRTQDLARLDGHERRLHRLEARRNRSK
jgi:hypothetical protein